MTQNFGKRALVALALGAGVATLGGLTNVQAQPMGSMNRASMMMQGWPMDSAKAAKMVMARYGAPDEATPSMLVWRNSGPWKRIIASNTTTPHNFPGPHPDSVEQFVSYKVPESKHDEIARFDGSVNIDRTRGEMSARCDAETHNVLALNLAHDIITGKRSVEGARAFYTRVVMIEKTKMQLHPYALRLNFSPQMSANDPDHISPKMRPMVRKMRMMGKM